MAHPGTMLIGVDFDWCVRFEEWCPVVLTSAAMPIDMGVLWAIGMVQEGTFAGGTFEAVSMPPLHEFESAVPAELWSELGGVRRGLADGTISTGWSPP